MKPEKGSEDMEDKVWDPMDLFIDIGMLITEARTPDLSVKGRVEGPHCPPIHGTPLHHCDKHREQCRKADQGRKQMILLYRNNIPMRIDVMLLPDCNHGHLEASTMEGANLNYPENSILMERWDIQINPKRTEKNEGFITGRILLQAVRSYLHFSQMSSWLTSSMGTLPLSIVYRIYAPGESISHSFSLHPDTHTFPAADLSHVAVRVAVSSLPRQETVPYVNCREEENQIGAAKYARIPVRKKTSPDKEPHQKSDKIKHDIVKPKSRQTSNYLPNTEQKDCNITGTIPKKNLKSSEIIPHDEKPDISKSFMKHKPPSGRKHKVVDKILDTSGNVFLQHPQPQIPDGQNRICTADKIRMHNVKESFREKPLIFPQSDAIGYGIMGGMKRLPSPKVLFTSSNNKGPQTYYKKRFIDLGQPGEESLELEEKVMTGKLKDLVQPLNADEIEAYLSSLSHKTPGKSGLETSLDNIPMTKCKFYIGEDESEKESNTCSESGFRPNFDTSLNYTDDDSDQSPKDICEHHEKQIEAKKDNLARNLFLKSFSEPGLSLEHSELSPVLESSSQTVNHSNKNVSETEISNGNSPEEVEFSDGEGSHDSTPTNSLSESKGVMTTKSCGLKEKLNLEDDFGLSSREATPTLELETKYENNLNKKCDNTLEKKFSTMNLSNTAKPSLSSNQHDCQNNVNEKIVDSSQFDDNSGNKPGLKGSSLCRQLLTKELHRNIQNDALTLPETERMPHRDEILQFRQNLGRSASMMFSTTTGLPTQSSPAPVKRKSTGRFDYDSSLINARAIKNALSCSKLVLQSESRTDQDDKPRILSTSAPASTNCLLGNFEESVLNGRIEPVGVVEGFNAEIGAGGSFCPKHLKLPVTAYFFQLSDDNAPSPYLGHINLEPVGKKGYHIPKCGTLQITLFNPNNTVVKMFVVMYDLSDMPPNCQTFLRQRTVYMPVDPNSCEPSYLRYLIHLRFASSKSGKIYLHTDIRLIFARDKFEFDPKVANYELRSFTEGPQNPKFSPKR